MDRDKAWQFIERMTGFAAGFTTIGLLALADRTGILRTMAGAGPLDVASIADRAGVDERYVEEIMSGLAVAGVLEYDPADGSFELSEEHAAVVADDTSPYSLAGYLDLLPAMATQLPALTEAVASGGGVPYVDFGELAVRGIERSNAPGTRILLTKRWLAAMPDVVERLQAGGRVVDIGCGTGTAALTMGEAYPATEVLGVDVDTRSIERANEKLAQAGLENVAFQVGEAASLEGRFDLVTAFDVIHDMARPREELRAIRKALGDRGVFLMLEPNVAADLEDDIGKDAATLTYGTSAMFCLTQSLSQGGMGLGAAWGPRRAEALCREAGFTEFTRLPIENPFSAFYRVEP
ncbi:MAG TPA: class I SAM-dependent methyltransferase [Acidimicrobiia bacterium]|nr:class I SAM-dependent methyltransferase [Acidimicrobiia bacterium]